MILGFIARISAVCFVLQFAAEQPCASAAGLSDEDLVRYVEARAESGEYVGMIVGFIDGNQRYVQAFGQTSKDDDARPDERTIFEISSVSKTFTATLLGTAVIAGDMSLSDAVNEHLEPGVRLAGYDGREITLLDLASHQSGLPNFPSDLEPAAGPNPYAHTDERDLVRSLNAFVPDSRPGQGYSYSAFAFATIAHVLSIKYDASYEQLVERRIAEPLGMADTVMRLNADQAKRLAPGYTPEGNVAEPLDQGVFRPAGSMYSTLHDLMIWLSANMGRLDSPLDGAVALTHPMRNSLNSVGLAWHQAGSKGDRSQFGTAHGYRAYVGFLEDGSKGAVVLANTKANVKDIGDRLLLQSELPAP